MLKFFLGVGLFISLKGGSFGQKALENIDIEFSSNGQKFSNPLAGGLDNPIFSEVDLNNDGYDDLFIFDYNGKSISCYLTVSESNQFKREYAPQFSEYTSFNKSDWVLLRDFNGDGIKDAFVRNSQNEQAWLSVYKGFYEENILKFTKYKNELTFLNEELSTPLFTGSFELPAIDDIDGDGDLDIVTYAKSLGNLTLYRNNSVQVFNHADSLNFEIASECWGGFLEVGDSVVLSDTPNDCIFDTVLVQKLAETKNEIFKKTSLHNGATLLTLDVDNDNDKDLILGDVFRSESLILLENNQSNNTDHFTKQTLCFPNYDFPIKIKYKPAAYNIDVDFDQKPDLIVSPFSNQLGNIENIDVCWFYKNEDDRFKFIESDWLVKDMLDVGSGSYPVIVDYNGDGLQDLVISNYGFFSNDKPTNSQLFLFENIGDENKPYFEFKDSNWLNLNQYLTGSSFAPTFGDIDNDNDIDVIIGLSNGELAYGENVSNTLAHIEINSFESFFGFIDAGQYAVPTLYDINEDTYLDLLIGNESGRILYFENKLSQGAIIFERMADDDFFGEIQLSSADFFRTYAAPVICEIDDKPNLFVGCIDGSIQQFTNIGIDKKAQLIEQNLLSDFYGYYSKIAFLVQDEKMSFMLGNIKGGINHFHYDQKMGTSSNNNQILNQAFKIYPNPVRDYVTIQVPESIKTNSFASIYKIDGTLALDAMQITNKNQKKYKNYYICVTCHYVNYFSSSVHWLLYGQVQLMK